MNRKTFITMSTGALVAPFVYAMTPSQGVHHVKMEAPRDLLKDMHAAWLGAIDLTRNDDTPGKIIVHAITSQMPDGPESIPIHNVQLHAIKPEDLPEFVKHAKIIVDQSMIEALAIMWMDTAANYDRRMTDEETKEFTMQFESFTDKRGKTMHYDRLVFGTEHFDAGNKFFKGKFKTPMQEQIVMAMTFGTIIGWVNRSETI